jgi:hypothetical protein
MRHVSQLKEGLCETRLSSFLCALFVAHGKTSFVSLELCSSCCKASLWIQFMFSLYSLFYA